MKTTELTSALKVIEQEAAPLFTTLSKIKVITSKEHYADVMFQVKSLKDLGRLAKESELAVTEPLNNEIKEVRNLFRPFLADVTNLELQLKQVLINFINKQEAAEKKLEADFSEGKITNINTFAKKSSELAMNKSGVRRTLKAQAVDETKTPRKYMIPDVSAITEALKEGKKVAGWILVEEKSVAI